MRASLEYRCSYLCVLIENGVEPKKWFPVRRADYPEVQTLLSRPVTSVNQQEGVYVDEEGNVYQLLDKGETKPIEVEHLPGTEKTELEVATGGFAEGRAGERKKRRRQAALEKESKRQS